jgi:hypothetical protein
MTEKDIEELLEAAKVVNRFRSLASTFVCPVCGEPLEGDIDSISLSILKPFGRLFCPNCRLFKVEGPVISDTDDGKDGKKLSRKEILIKASTGVVAVVESYTHLTLLAAEHEKDFSDKDIPFLR